MFIKIYHLFFSDIDGLGSSAIGGQLINRSSTHSPLGCDVVSSDAVTAGEFSFVTQHYQHIHSFISSVFLFFFVFFRISVLPFCPHRRLEELDGRSVHAPDGSHGGQLTLAELQQRTESEGEGRHLSESGRSQEGCRSQLLSR